MRSKSVFGILVVLLTISILTNFSFAQKDENKKEETITCPVSCETVLKSEAAGPYKYNDSEYYFCCNGCMEKFKKDPETYLYKTTDLVCGMSVDKRTAIKATVDGKDYYFCSEGCKKSFEKDPKTYTMKAMKTSHEHGENCEGCDDCSHDKAKMMKNKGEEKAKAAKGVGKEKM